MPPKKRVVVKKKRSTKQVRVAAQAKGQAQKQSQKVQVNVTIAQPKSKRTTRQARAVPTSLEPTARLMSTYAQAPPITSPLKQVMNEKADVRGNQVQLAGDWTKEFMTSFTENMAKAVHKGIKMGEEEPPMAAPSMPNLNSHAVKAELEDRMPRGERLSSNARSESKLIAEGRSSPCLVKDLIHAYEKPPPRTPTMPKLYPVKKMNQYARLNEFIHLLPVDLGEKRAWFKLPENADLDRGFMEWWKNNP
jgi:hypothetical protein